MLHTFRMYTRLYSLRSSIQLVTVHTVRNYWTCENNHVLNLFVGVLALKRAGVVLAFRAVYSALRHYLSSITTGSQAFSSRRAEFTIYSYLFRPYNVHLKSDATERFWILTKIVFWRVSNTVAFWVDHKTEFDTEAPPLTILSKNMRAMNGIRTHWLIIATPLSHNSLQQKSWDNMEMTHTPKQPKNTTS